MSARREMLALSRKVDGVFAREGVRLTLGGEPTVVPVKPEGAEWNYSAVGPTKLAYARAMAEHLLKTAMRGGISIFSPGKSYPGEVNPRWAIRLLSNRNGKPFSRFSKGRKTSAAALSVFRKQLSVHLGVTAQWKKIRDPRKRGNVVWALAIDHDDRGWTSYSWPGAALSLSEAEGPAGLRLPLHTLPPKVPKRALVIEVFRGEVSVFLPPVSQKGFLDLLDSTASASRVSGVGRLRLQGYVPPDEKACWTHLGLTADPGVLEINLPACDGWERYDHWVRAVQTSAQACGLRSWKTGASGFPEGTGGGNHLLWGGPSLEENPFFSRPGWIASIVRYWQKHPSLSYLFTGCYVGPSSQAPRADESARDTYDIEMALRFLESLGEGDHRSLISETLRHLQTDITGNSHRSEISLDKFWNPGWPAGTLGLIEFRAIESLPRSEWTGGVALLWSALACHLLRHPQRESLVDHAGALHDRYFLPTPLWEDLAKVLGDLAASGLVLPKQVFRSIWEWKFPVLLEVRRGRAWLQIRRAHEGWPLLCETPVEGGTTSRFVDTSMRRIEILANDAFAKTAAVRVANRPLPLRDAGKGLWMAGLRYRETNLYPSLHPGLPPQMPLQLGIERNGRIERYRFEAGAKAFRSFGVERAGAPGRPCKPGKSGDLTFDLRIP